VPDSSVSVAILRVLWITIFITSNENFGFSGRPVLVILSVEIGEFCEKSIITRKKIRVTLKETLTDCRVSFITMSRVHLQMSVDYFVRQYTC